jgi:hypothetical protein
MRTYDRIDENQHIEVTRFGQAEREFLNVGMRTRLATVRADYIADRIDLEEFEAETARLLAKLPAL